MITLDETIAKEKEEAKRLRKIIETGYDGEISIEAIFCDDTDAIKEAYERFENCVKEHKQIAEWLEELKDYRERECNHINEALYDKGYSDGYNKAIDEAMDASAKAICIGCGYLEGTKCKYKGGNCGVSKPMLETVMKALEQLKKRSE